MISSSVALGPAERDVLPNRTIEEERVLQHHSELRAVRTELDGR